MSYRGTGRRGVNPSQASSSISSEALIANDGLLIPAPPAGKSIIIHSIALMGDGGKLGTDANGEGIKVGHLNGGNNSFGRGLIIPKGQPVYTDAQSGDTTVTYSIADGQSANRISNDGTSASQPTTTTTVPCNVNVYFVSNTSSVTEGNSASSTHNVTVERSANCGVTTVDYVTNDGSATSPSDYNSTSGTLTFNAGITSLQISITIQGDTNPENNETFSITLSNQTQTSGTATITSGHTHTVTITNDDSETMFVAGTVPDWIQPIYYENSGSITPGHVSNPAAHYSQWHSGVADSWCAPTAAASQLGHLNSLGLALPDKSGGHKSGISDIIDAGDFDNPDHGNNGTKVWDSEMGWGDYLIDGPSVRWCRDCMFPEYDYTGTVIGGCELSDFGWFMNTNDSSTSSSAGGTRVSNPSPSVNNLINLSPIGTTVHNVYLGLKDFYRTAGYDDMVGIVYHRPSDGTVASFPTGTLPNGTPEQPTGVRPRYWINNSLHSSVDSQGHMIAGVDAEHTWHTIKTEINENRTVIACLQGWNVSSTSYSLPTGFPNTSHPVESVKVGGAPNGIDYWSIGGSIAVGFDGTPYTCSDCTLPPHWGGTALGHTVLIVGYILAGASDDVSQEGDTDWIIVRDNHSSTSRNVIIPFKSGDENRTNTTNVQTIRWARQIIMATVYADLGQATTNIASCP